MIPVSAHIGGVPVEETLASLGPVLLVGVGMTVAMVRDRLRRLRPERRRPRGVG